MSLNQYNDPFHVDVWSESNKGGSVVTVAGAPASAPTQQPTPSTTPASAPQSINPLMLLLAAVAVVTIIASIN